MKKLRIGIISPIHWCTPPRHYGPWEQVASNICEELVRRGHDVTLYATADSKTKAKLKSVCPHPLLEEKGKKLEDKVYAYMHSTMAFEDAKDFDIIHNHYDGYPMVFSRLVDVPVVDTVHGFSSTQIRELYKRYDNVNYVSISMADRRQCPDMNWAANVYHGMDIKEWEFADKSEDWIGFIGRIHPTKGTHLAIQAAMKADVKLKIAGAYDDHDPVSIKYWEMHVKPFIDGDKVEYLGEIGGKDKIEFYQKAKATMAPICWEEPFGMVLIESMAVGTPVIAFGRGSVPEVVRDGVGGIVVESDDVDGLVKAIARVGEIDRLGVRKYCEENFSIEHMVDEYEKLYYSLVK